MQLFALTDSPESQFTDESQGVVTVAEYFAKQNKRDPVRYPPLRYPQLPVVNVGGGSKPVYIPCELIAIVQGQTRSKTLTGNMTATLIKEAAVKPDDRMKYITPDEGLGLGQGQHSIIQEIQNDITAEVMLSNFF